MKLAPDQKQTSPLAQSTAAAVATAAEADVGTARAVAAAALTARTAKSDLKRRGVDRCVDRCSDTQTLTKHALAGPGNRARWDAGTVGRRSPGTFRDRWNGHGTALMAQWPGYWSV
ncbi:hypothetical protein PV735_34725 [Streptomyces turgidiscabies]|uniref:hypothetical protein n=1 Tax=Streptomyces turgidiscabies TaxID=85558 RepID=UPI000ABFAFA7|nr:MULTISPECIES: hypothetical protein [Streptomyces]MDX3497809.1 hypothetical protein [Streptomyces turgidiscabies]